MSRAPTPGGSSRCTSSSASSAWSMRRPTVEIANHILQVDLEQTHFVEVVNDVLGQFADDRLAVEEAELIGQVVVE